MLVLESVQGMGILGRESILSHQRNNELFLPSLWHDLYPPSGGTVQGQVGQVVDRINSCFGYLGISNSRRSLHYLDQKEKITLTALQYLYSIPTMKR